VTTDTFDFTIVKQNTFSASHYLQYLSIGISGLFVVKRTLLEYEDSVVLATHERMVPIHLQLMLVQIQHWMIQQSRRCNCRRGGLFQIQTQKGHYLQPHPRQGHPPQLL
jgi:hypothetical protein